MLDAEWRLVYPGVDVTFGTPTWPVFNATTPSLGDVNIRVVDGDRPRSDGQTFGADYFGSRTLGFDLGVRGPDEATVRDTAAALAVAWRADSIRSTPGAVAQMRSQYRGSERIAYGRPRKFALNLALARTALLATATATFVCADDRWYDAAVTTATIGVVAALGGGLTAPLASPLATTASSSRVTTLTVGGLLPAWPVVTITGPITNPSVTVVGRWTLAFNTTLTSGQSLVVDTRPWARTILRDGASVAGTVTPASPRLAACALPPGTYVLGMAGSSATGTATAQVTCRAAYPTP